MPKLFYPRVYVAKTKCFFRAAFVLVALLATSCTGPRPAEINLAIWNNYLDESVVRDFEEAHKIQVRVSNYASNEELLAKVQTGGSGIDVAVPSDYMVEIMKERGLLLELDRSLLPGFGGIDPKWLGLEYDSSNKYSLPYGWSVTGIAFDREKVSPAPSSWKDLLTREDLKGRFSLLDDLREVVGLGLKINGFSMNSSRDEDLELAMKTLVGATSKVKMFRSDVIDSLTQREVLAAQAYSTDALKAARKSKLRVSFVVPSEGSTLAVDNLVILKSSAQSKAAHLFLDYLLRRESNQKLVSLALTGPVIKGVHERLSAEDKALLALVPTTHPKGLERIKNLGTETGKLEKVWNKIRAN